MYFGGLGALFPNLNVYKNITLVDCGIKLIFLQRRSVPLIGRTGLKEHLNKKSTSFPEVRNSVWLWQGLW